MTAGTALQAETVSALKEVLACGIYDAPPLQSAYPYALVEAGPEADWSHKSGTGREVRMIVTIHDKGETPAWLRSIAESVEQAAAAVSSVPGWKLVTLRHLRTRLVKDGPQRGAGGTWAAAIELRARMLKA